MSKLMNLTNSPKTMTGSVWLTIAVAVVTALSENLSVLRGAVDPVIYLVAVIVVGGAMTALHHWQAKRRKWNEAGLSALVEVQRRRADDAEAALTRAKRKPVAKKAAMKKRTAKKTTGKARKAKA